MITEASRALHYTAPKASDCHADVFRDGQGLVRFCDRLERPAVGFDNPLPVINLIAAIFVGICGEATRDRRDAVSN